MKIEDLQIGQALPIRTHTATNVSLFCYNAAVWNPHRIHYDETYTKEVEHHPGVVIDGPLQGDWLSQVAINWVGDQGSLEQFSYSNRQAAYLGETLTSGGTITAIDSENRTVHLEIYIKNEREEIITPGKATVRLQS